MEKEPDGGQFIQAAKTNSHYLQGLLTYLPHLQLFHPLYRSIESYSTVAKSTPINRTTHFRRALDQEKGMPPEIA